jgi:hypothetical protein
LTPLSGAYCTWDFFGILKWDDFDKEKYKILRIFFENYKDFATKMDK